MSDIPERGPQRAVIERVRPTVDGGRFAAKRVEGEELEIAADVFADGHDVVRAVAILTDPDGRAHEIELEPTTPDRFVGTFRLGRIGAWSFSVIAWVDRFATWRRDLRKRLAAGQDLRVELQVGAELVAEAAERADPLHAPGLAHARTRLADRALDVGDRVTLALGEGLLSAMRDSAPRRFGVTTRTFPLWVDRRLGGFSAWYELFPRSTAHREGEHGTFRTAADRLEYVADLGFDIVYLPPIHPIGRVHRKGRNGRTEAERDDVGSPWAIGAAEGGHTAIHPQLGTLDDFRGFLARAQELGLEVALDLAFQCAPDHPWVQEHPSWFRHLPDGSIRYAENPPKKYQDIYPLDFESEDWEALWHALRDVVRFWVDQGVRVFRVDNPHTKPFAFWEWLIADLQEQDPRVIFLSEAFTRRPVMQRLAKLGFTQSYTYFTWKNSKHELTEYATELFLTDVADFMRPNFWPNTPDILNASLQIGGRAATIARCVLAATLSPNWGVYGPVLELVDVQAREPGSEEYRDSEKYQVWHHAWDAEHSLRDVLARLNQIRREHPCLQVSRGLHWVDVDNEQLIAYLRMDGDSQLLVVVNLDPHHTHGGFLRLPLDLLGLEPRRAHQVHDLFGGERFLWTGERNYVELDPRRSPAHVFRVRRHVRTEADFDYFL